MDLSAIASDEFLGLDSFLFYGEGEGEPPATPGSDVLDALSDDPPADPEVPDADLDALIEALGLDAESFLWAGSASGPSAGPTQQAGVGSGANLAVGQGSTGGTPHETPAPEPFISDIPGVTPVDKPHDPPVSSPLTQASPQVLPQEPPHETPAPEPFISDIPGVTPVDKPHDPPITDPIIPDMVPDADSLLFL